MQSSATTTGKPNAARTPAASARSRNASQATGRSSAEIFIEARGAGAERVEARALAHHELHRLDVAGRGVGDRHAVEPCARQEHDADSGEAEHVDAGPAQ